MEKKLLKSSFYDNTFYCKNSIFDILPFKLFFVITEQMDQKTLLEFVLVRKIYHKSFGNKRTRTVKMDTSEIEIDDILITKYLIESKKYNIKLHLEIASIGDKSNFNKDKIDNVRNIYDSETHNIVIKDLLINDETFHNHRKLYEFLMKKKIKLETLAIDFQSLNAEKSQFLLMFYKPKLHESIEAWINCSIKNKKTLEKFAKSFFDKYLCSDFVFNEPNSKKHMHNHINYENDVVNLHFASSEFSQWNGYITCCKYDF